MTRAWKSRISAPSKVCPQLLWDERKKRERDLEGLNNQGSKKERVSLCFIHTKRPKTLRSLQAHRGHREKKNTITKPNHPKEKPTRESWERG